MLHRPTSIERASDAVIRQLSMERMGRSAPKLAPFGMGSGFGFGWRPPSGAAAMPTWQDVGTPQANAAGITVPWPTHAIDDIGILVVKTAGGQPASLTTAHGFVDTPDSPQDSTGSGAGSCSLSCYWCRATSTTMSSPVVADSGNHQYGVIFTIRGCVASDNPYDVTAGDALSVASTSVSAPGDTTTGANRLIVVIVGHAIDVAAGNPQFSSWANADLSDVTERYDDTTDVNAGGGIGIATGGKAAAGAFGATTATLASSSRQCRIVIALRPE
jgi:hypothetical protein